MRNTINWFEIPVSNLERATQFYSTIFEVEMHPMPEYEGIQSAFFPDEGGVSGCLVCGKDYVPSRAGSLVYLNGGDNLSGVLDRVEGAGGVVEMPKTGIGEHGFVAMLVDTEGNRIGLHSLG